MDGYALPLEGPGLGIEANAVLVDEELAASKPFVPSLQPRLNGPLKARLQPGVGAGFLEETSSSGRKQIATSALLTNRTLAAIRVPSLRSEPSIWRV